MATSPNYGWLEPDNTDLVKNGALAIRTLGNAIDSTMATMVPKSIVDAKGDLIAGTAADTTSRLAVGANGETLVADSSTATGLRYQSGYNGNAIINGGLDFWQRGTSFAAPTSNTYTADRFIWQSSSVASKTISRQLSGLTGFQYSMRVARDSGNTNTAANYIGYSMETTDALRFAGQTATFSFYARAGANYSPTSSLLGVRWSSGTGTDQNYVSNGYTGNVNLVDTTQAITTTWTRYTFTASIGSTATEIGFFFSMTPTGTAGANDWFEVTGIQLELGSVATSFKRSSGGTIQGELAACQRYYNGNTFAFRLSAGATNLANAITMYLPQMRSLPTLAYTAAASATNNISGTPTLDVLQSDTATYAARINFNANAANGDTFYVRAFSASAEL